MTTKLILMKRFHTNCIIAGNRNVKSYKELPQHNFFNTDFAKHCQTLPLVIYLFYFGEFEEFFGWKEKSFSGVCYINCILNKTYIRLKKSNIYRAKLCMLLHVKFGIIIDVLLV